LKRNKGEIYFDVLFPVLFVALLVYEVTLLDDTPEYLILIIAFFVPLMYEPLCISILNRVVNEKETKMKETLKMTGMTLEIYGFSYMLA